MFPCHGIGAGCETGYCSKSCIANSLVVSMEPGSCLSWDAVGGWYWAAVLVVLQRIAAFGERRL